MWSTQDWYSNRSNFFSVNNFQKFIRTPGEEVLLDATEFNNDRLCGQIVC